METIELTCINCPMGCHLTVSMENSAVADVAGNSCSRGDTYARKEVTNPTRIVTTTVKAEGGIHPRVSVKTREDVPKGKIFDCMKAVCGLTVQAPVRIGDTVFTDVAGTGVDIVATSEA